MRIILTTHNGKQTPFTSLKKVCERFKIDYRTVGDALRKSGQWSNDIVKVKRMDVE